MTIMMVQRMIKTGITLKARAKRSSFGFSGFLVIKYEGNLGVEVLKGYWFAKDR